MLIMMLILEQVPLPPAPLSEPTGHVISDGKFADSDADSNSDSDTNYDFGDDLDADTGVDSTHPLEELSISQSTAKTKI